MTTSAHADDLSFAKHLGDLAQQLTLANFGGRHDVKLKPDSTPVTEIDASVERLLREEIASVHPGDGVLGEEGGLRSGDNGRLWVIDPIDGTKLFAEGIPLWTTLIALQHDGEVVVGLADAPALGERCVATKAGGAWRDNEPLLVSTVSELSDAFILYPGLEDLADAQLATVRQLMQLARGSRGLSDAWAHLLIARGAAEALVEVAPCHVWDWAATALIVEEAGGTITALSGGPPQSGQGLLVGNGAVNDAVMAVLNDG